MRRLSRRSHATSSSSSGYCVRGILASEGEKRAERYGGPACDPLFFALFNVVLMAVASWPCALRFRIEMPSARLIFTKRRPERDERHFTHLWF
ncbi:hypothetical protein Y032_0741g1978 [Ancylostoma ceylanicum]|uniref:Uncharacterized protein n=1 Tax=Ancylostoma ceylanicum TaxID=53326 RepID=A0A016WGK2_9BILA|nr:hypothetical protein Y032_0741g1978 [Ancylostoma ceylanicum]